MRQRRDFDGRASLRAPGVKRDTPGLAPRDGGGVGLERRLRLNTPSLNIPSSRYLLPPQTDESRAGYKTREKERFRKGCTGQKDKTNKKQKDQGVKPNKAEMSDVWKPKAQQVHNVTGCKSKMILCSEL